MTENLTTDDLAAKSPAADDTATDAPLARDSAGEARREDEVREPLLDAGQASSFTERWREIQVDFVDRPRESVEQADSLVAELMQQLASSFAEERGRLEQQWEGGDEVSTEDLRVALTRYRSFFDRLLSA
jgi:polyhydroxyalkanoate synthesis regulator phasin